MNPFSTPADISPAPKKAWQRLHSNVSKATAYVQNAPTSKVSGCLVKANGVMMEAEGCRLETGQRCIIQSKTGTSEAEVVGFSHGIYYLMPVEEVGGLSPGDRVTPLGKNSSIAVGKELLGQIIDGAGRTLDDGLAINASDSIPLYDAPINPVHRQPVQTPLDTGIRSINSLMTVGKGQRLGLFSSAGMGKSTLLNMLAKNTEADVVIISLIGERGREVGEFIARMKHLKSMQRTVLIAAPADHAPVMRMRAALLSHRIAEYFRDSGLHVLLLMDSLTRYAQARREIGLSIGEPPATRGYPASSLGMMAKLVERAGNSANTSGSLTAFYTILMEPNQTHDPVAEAARAVLDGHLILSQEMASSGIYPAIDVLSSLSRTMAYTVSPEHLQLSRKFRQFLELAREGKDLVTLGVYQKGGNPLMDSAMEQESAMMTFLQQGVDDYHSLQASISGLEALLTFQESKLAE